jgi:hypothetical protein
MLANLGRCLEARQDLVRKSNRESLVTKEVHFPPYFHAALAWLPYVMK